MQIPSKTVPFRWPLFAMLFVCFAAAILGDSTAEALLLSHFDSRLIPRMFMVNALFLFFFSAFFMSLIDRVDRGRFFSIALGIHGTFLFLIWLAVQAHISFLFLPLFSYAYVSKIMLFMLFWTLANDLVDSRKAGVEFPIIASGGTLGAITIGFSIPTLLTIISASNLLLVWAGLAFVLMILFIPVKKRFKSYFVARNVTVTQSKRSLKSIAADLKVMKNEPLLKNMSVLYFFMFFILLNQHFGFYTNLQNHFSDGFVNAGGTIATRTRHIAVFLGYFNGVCMAITFLLQITVSGRLIRRIGSTRSLFVVPSVLCCAFGVLLALQLHVLSSDLPGWHNVLFWGIVVCMGIRIGFFDAFFSPNFQIFFSSLPQEIRGRGKLAIEGVVKPLAIICASLWILFVASRLPLYANTLVLFLVSIAAIIQTFRLKGHYTDSLTRYLKNIASHNIRFTQEKMDQAGQKQYFDYLHKALQTEQPEVKHISVELLAELNTDESAALLARHALLTDETTYAMIISSLGRFKRAELKPFFSRALAHTNRRVVANAVLALAVFDEREIIEGLEAFLHHPDNRVRANTILALWYRVPWIRQKDFFGVLKAMLTSEKNVDRASALYVIGELEHIDFFPLLEEFAHGQNEECMYNRMVWKQYIRALSKNQSSKALDVLLAIGQKAGRKNRRDVSQMLVHFFSRSPGSVRLKDRLHHGSASDRSMLLGMLFYHIDLCTPEIYPVLEKITDELVSSIYHVWCVVAALRRPGAGQQVLLLANAVYEEGVVDTLQALIWCAALLDKSKKIRTVVNRLNHDNNHVRARAFEVLDNEGNARINRWIIRLCETNTPAVHIKMAREQFGEHEMEHNAALDECLRSENTWVQECAFFAKSQLTAAL